MAGKQKAAAASASAVRAAVDRTYQATVGSAQLTRERAQELVDEVSQAAGRVRTVLEDLRVATGDDIRALHNQLDRLERRVAKLEGPKPKRQAPKKKKS